MALQTSMVFNQVKWPGAGDVDDCWVVSSLQAMNVTAPELRLVSVPTFRVAAGNPDMPGPTGGSLEDTIQGMVNLFPFYAGELRKLKGWTWDDFADLAREHRPMSVAVISGKLPTRLRYGFVGDKSFHRITVVVKGAGRWLVANPLAPVYSRWEEVNPLEIKPAIMAYGRHVAGHSGVYAVAFPTDVRMAALLNGMPDDPTPYSQEDLDSATALLQEKIDAAKAALEGTP
jgi:hypothetical protein